MSDVVVLSRRTTRQAAPVPLVQRAPLVMPVPGLEHYRDELPWVPPLTRDYLRADAWGITMPGAPWVPGAASDVVDGFNTWERILSWFIDRYPLSFQQRYLETTASYGYTHVLLSYGDSCGPVDNGPNSPPGNGRSLEQFIETCLLVKSVTSARDNLPLSVLMWVGSKYFHPSNMSVQQYQDYFGPVYEALFKAHAVDEVMPGGEWNLWQIPGDPTLGIFKWVGKWGHENRVTTWFHGSPHYMWWGEDGTDRFQFWEDLGADVDGVNYQGDPAWCADETQARAVDTLWQFGTQGNVHKFRYFEDIAMYQWNGQPLPPTMQQADEAQGVARGYTNCCTVDNVRHTDAKVWGYGNGGSMPDGSPL